MEIDIKGLTKRIKPSGEKRLEVRKHQAVRKKAVRKN
jgi:hypothetical protein